MEARKYTSDIDSGDFESVIGKGLVVAGIIFLITVVIGLFAYIEDSEDFAREQNTLMILQGKSLAYDEKNKSAIEAAQTFKLLYAEQFNFSQLNGYNNKQVSAAKDQISSGMSNWNQRAKYLNDPNLPLPEDKTGKNMEDALLLMLIVYCLFIPSYIYARRDDDSSNEWWQYPWRKWWAYPAILIFSVYVAVIQPVVLVYAIFNEAYLFAAGKVRDPEMVQTEADKKNSNWRNDTAISRERKDFNVEVYKKMKKINFARINFANIGTALLILKGKTLEEEIKSLRKQVSDHGIAIQTLQKKIGETTGQMKVLDDTLAEAKGKPDLVIQFEKILSIPTVRAIDVNGHIISVFTETICIKHKDKTYEIGSATIKIDAAKNYPIIDFAAYTSLDRKHPHSTDNKNKFCFGDYDGEIEKHISAQRYYEAVLVILHSLQTINTRSWGDSMDQWKIIQEV